VVYKAKTRSLAVRGREVSRRTCERPQALERFRREARAASALSHPNICTIHEMPRKAGISSSLWSISMARRSTRDY